MRTATAEDLCQHGAEVLGWIEAGEEVAISKDGVIVARLLPEKPSIPEQRVDWSQSAAFRMDKSKMKMLSQKEVDSILKDGSGQW